MDASIGFARARTPEPFSLHSTGTPPFFTRSAVGSVVGERGGIISTMYVFGCYGVSKCAGFAKAGQDGAWVGGCGCVYGFRVFYHRFEAYSVKLHQRNQQSGTDFGRSFSPYSIGTDS